MAPCRFLAFWEKTKTKAPIIMRKLLQLSRITLSKIHLYALGAVLATSCSLKEAKSYVRGSSSEEEERERPEPRTPSSERRQQLPVSRQDNRDYNSEIGHNYSFGSTYEVNTHKTSTSRVLAECTKEKPGIQPRKAKEYYEAHNELRCIHENIQTMLSAQDEVKRIQKFCLEVIVGALTSERKLPKEELDSMLSLLRSKGTPFICQNAKCTNNKSDEIYNLIAIDYGVSPWSCFCLDCQSIDLKEKSVVRDTRLEIPIVFILDYPVLWSKREITSKNFIAYLDFLEAEYDKACERYNDITIEERQALATKKEEFYSKSHRLHQYLPFSFFGFESKMCKLNKLAETVNYRQNRTTYCEKESTSRRFEQIYRHICIYEINRLLTDGDVDYLMTKELLRLLENMRAEKLMEIMYLEKKDMQKVLLLLSVFARELSKPLTNLFLEKINEYDPDQRWLENFDDIMGKLVTQVRTQGVKNSISKVVGLIKGIEERDGRLLSNLDPTKLSILCDFFNFKTEVYANDSILEFLKATHYFIEPRLHPSTFESLVLTYVNSTVDVGSLETIIEMRKSIKFEHLTNIFRCRYPRIISKLIENKVFEMQEQELAVFYHNLEVQQDFLEHYNKYFAGSEETAQAIGNAIKAAIQQLDKVDGKTGDKGAGSKIFEDVHFRQSCETDLRKPGSILRQGSSGHEAKSNRSSLRRTERPGNFTSRSGILYSNTKGEQESKGTGLSRSILRESEE